MHSVKVKILEIIGEAFPADGKIIFGATNADEALLTGESAAIRKSLHAKFIAGSFN